MASVIKSMRKRLVYNWKDNKTNTEVLNELKIVPVTEKINVYKSNWTNRVNRMPRIDNNDIDDTDDDDDDVDDNDNNDIDNDDNDIDDHDGIDDSEDDNDDEDGGDNYGFDGDDDRVISLNRTHLPERHPGEAMPHSRVCGAHSLTTVR